MKLLPNTIINFHDVHDEVWLESVFILLKKHYQIVSANTIENFYYNGLNLKNVCHITFDDGHRSFYELVFPLLKKHQIPASLYVSPYVVREQVNFWFQEIKGYDENILLDIIKNDPVPARGVGFDSTLKSYLKSMDIERIWSVINQYQQITSTPVKPCVNLNIEQLSEIDKSDFVDIGAHTQTHPILSNESDQRSSNEIKNSIHELSDLLNRPVLYFAYPNGAPGTDFGDREIKTLSKLGVKLAFSTEKKSFTIDANPLSIPRNGLSMGNKMFVLSKLALGKHWDTFKKLLK